MPTKKSRADHCKIEGLGNAYRLFCLHCGDSFMVGLPIKLSLAPRIIDAFVAEHKKCKKPENDKMIESENQYRIAKKQLKQYYKDLLDPFFDKKPPEITPALWEAKKAALTGKILILEKKIKEYEGIKP